MTWQRRLQLPPARRHALLVHNQDAQRVSDSACRRHGAFPSIVLAVLKAIIVLTMTTRAQNPSPRGRRVHQLAPRLGTTGVYRTHSREHRRKRNQNVANRFPTPEKTQTRSANEQTKNSKSVARRRPSGSQITPGTGKNRNLTARLCRFLSSFWRGGRFVLHWDTTCWVFRLRVCDLSGLWLGEQ